MKFPWPQEPLPFAACEPFFMLSPQTRTALRPDWLCPSSVQEEEGGQARVSSYHQPKGLCYLNAAKRQADTSLDAIFFFSFVKESEKSEIKKKNTKKIVSFPTHTHTFFSTDRPGPARPYSP